MQFLLLHRPDFDHTRVLPRGEKFRSFSSRGTAAAPDGSSHWDYKIVATEGKSIHRQPKTSVSAWCECVWVCVSVCHRHFQAFEASALVSCTQHVFICQMRSRTNGKINTAEKQEPAALMCDGEPRRVQQGAAGGTHYRKGESTR